VSKYLCSEIYMSYSRSCGSVKAGYIKLDGKYIPVKKLGDGYMALTLTHFHQWIDRPADLKIPKFRYFKDNCLPRRRT